MHTMAIRLVAAAVVVLAATSCGLGAAEPPRGLTHEEAPSCTDGIPSMSGSLAVASAARLLGLPHGPTGDDAVVDLADPTTAALCRLAHELWGLSDEQWDWCFADENRAAYLTPAVDALGMGEEEDAGTESFGEAPGDDPFEYTQACRWAFDRWREHGVSAIEKPADDPFFMASPEATKWCAAELTFDAAAWFRNRLGIEVRADASAAEVALAEARTCRAAYIVRGLAPAS